MSDPMNRLVRMMVLAAGVAACGAGGDTGPRGEPGADGRGAVVDPALSALDKAVHALGGAPAIQQLAGMSYRASGTRYAQGERSETTGRARDVGSFELEASVDLGRDAFRTDIVREVAYPFAASLRYSNIVREQLGYVSGSNNVIGAPEGPMSSARWASLRKEFSLLNPLLIVRRALERPETTSERGVQLVNGAPHHALEIELPQSYGGSQPVTLFVHAATGLVSKVAVLENDHLLRDVQVEVFYADYLRSGDVRTPRSVLMSVAGELVLAETRRELTIEPSFAADRFDFPGSNTPTYAEIDAHRAATSHQWHEQFHSLGLPFDAQELTITANEVAPGVFHLTGALHHSLVVEQRSGIVVVEAPLYPERTDAIIAWTRERFPNKPITHAISTHHHVDHSAGLRSFVAEGAMIVASARAEAVYRQAFAAPSTVNPDRLSREPKPVRLLPVPVAGKIHLDDPERAIEVHHLASTHSDDNVLISLPAQGVVFQSDLYSPGFPLNELLARELRDQIVSLGVNAKIMAPGHGAMSSFAELEAALVAR